MDLFVEELITQICEWSPMSGIMSYNSKGYLNITQFREKVNMLNIFQQGIFDEKWYEWWSV
jgi:hypothetical protein